MKQKIKNGMKVKIKKSEIKYNWSSTVPKIYKEQETCRVINAHIELDRSKQPPAEHWVCDLQREIAEIEGVTRQAVSKKMQSKTYQRSLEDWVQILDKAGYEIKEKQYEGN